MKLVTKIAAASVLALSIAAPAFAAEETLLQERNTYSVNTAVDAMAYAPAHAKPGAKSTTTRDLGIGSQS